MAHTCVKNIYVSSWHVKIELARYLLYIVFFLLLALAVRA
jgi:hypothetical protein